MAFYHLCHYPLIWNRRGEVVADLGIRRHSKFIHLRYQAGICKWIPLFNYKQDCRKSISKQSTTYSFFLRTWLTYTSSLQIFRPRNHTPSFLLQNQSINGPPLAHLSQRRLCVLLVRISSHAHLDEIAGTGLTSPAKVHPRPKFIGATMVCVRKVIRATTPPLLHPFAPARMVVEVIWGVNIVRIWLQKSEVCGYWCM